MATQPDTMDDFEEDAPDLDLDDEDEGQGEDTQQDNKAEPAGDDDEEVDVVGWGEQTVDAQDEPEGMRNLRARLREVERENKTLKTATAPKVDEVGPKPDMDDYWDKPEQFETDLLAWSERRRAAEQRETQQQEAARKQQERWEAQSRDFDAGYADLRVPGKDAALATVEDAFPGEQKAYLVKAAGKNAPAFLLALGNNADKRGELRALADEGSWAEFIATAAIMSREVNVQRKPKTAPEKRHAVEGMSGGTGHRTDARRDRLERDAEKSGDYSALIRYDREMRTKKNG